MGIRHIVESKWWTRTWVLQEATVPEEFNLRRWVLGQSFQAPKGKVKVLCGKEATTWFAISTMLIAVPHLRKLGRLTSEVPLGLQAPAEAVYQFRLNRLSKLTDIEDLLVVLQQFRITNATDPRDKVYAPLCLASKDAAGAIVPNLSKDTRLVILDVATYSLSQPGRELDFLGYAMLSDQTPVESPLHHRNRPIPSGYPTDLSQW